MTNNYKNIILATTLLSTGSILSAQGVLSSIQVTEKIPNIPAFEVYYEGKNLKCYPLKTIKNKNNRDMIEYFCSNSDIQVSTSTVEEIDGEQGQIDTQQLITSTQDKVDIGETYSIEIDSRYANNDRRVKFIAKQQLSKKLYGKFLGRLIPAKIYISIRPQLSSNGEEGGMELKNAGTRGGFFYYQLLGDDIELMMQYEGGIDFNSGVPFMNISDGDNSNRRLSYISLRHNQNDILIGKYWSAYYDIAAFTDYFMAYGAQASGAFNNETDGGVSGTGRADRIVQISHKETHFSAKLQIQAPHQSADNLDAQYQYGLSGNFIYKGLDDIRLGASFAYSKFDEITLPMREVGLCGNDQSYIIGFTYKKKKFSINSTLSYTKNHMNDDRGIYFDSIGAEVYMRYNLSDSYRIAAGINRLSPLDSDYSTSYNIKKNILSLQYTFGSKTFDDLVYMEVSVPNGRLSNGDNLTTSVAIGMRYLFSR